MGVSIAVCHPRSRSVRVVAHPAMLLHDSPSCLVVKHKQWRSEGCRHLKMATRSITYGLPLTSSRGVPYFTGCSRPGCCLQQRAQTHVEGSSPVWRPCFCISHGLAALDARKQQCVVSGLTEHTIISSSHLGFFLCNRE